MDYLLKTWPQQFHPWAWNLIVVLTALILGLIFKFIITSIFHYYKNRDDYSLFKSIITRLGKPLNFFAPLLVLDLMLPLLEIDRPFVRPLPHLVEILLVIAFASFFIIDF